MPIFNEMKYYHMQEVAGKIFVFSHSVGDCSTLNKLLEGKDLTEDDIEALMYSRHRFLHGGLVYENTCYVYGHTPAYYYHDSDSMRPHVWWGDGGDSAEIKLDTGCCDGRALSALLIDAETGELDMMSFPYTEPPVNAEPDSDEYKDYFDWYLDECVKEAGDRLRRKKNKKNS